MKNKFFKFISNRTALLALLLLIVMVIFSLASKWFFTVVNLLGSLQFGAVLALVGIGQTIIWLGGGSGIDLSVGAMLSLSGVIMGIAYRGGIPLPIAMAMAIATGVILGLVNGLLVAYVGIPPLIGTLGTQYLYSSVALYLTSGMPISGYPTWFSWISLKTTLEIPNQVLFIVIPVLIIAYFLLYRTTLGRRIYLVGNNANAARLCAISPEKTRFWLYTISGALAGIGSIIMCSWLMTSKANAGDNLDMQSITVAALGGVSVAGGQGNLLGMIMAVLIITFMNSGLDLCGVNSIWQLALQGGILIFAIVLNQLIARYSQRGLE